MSKRQISPIHRSSPFLRRRWLGVGFRPPGQPELEREMQKTRELALEIGWSLRRSEERLDSSLQRIDSTLQELAVQREQIRKLELALGIER